eukprot:CAMPEP_0181209448 /NCGR_PEP_ID=MMETSP1096-20121128/22674_1 /TAXON_ID=156174 ORGANISM="Chrysochromulina ericina, Strain CCMP281" /NCGR_SAMPLE_ID=MMETSP1096 /ASSEMBLY_ACC=CAM_ASM_000453 /LENGTH=47 /DNA_ID= /DNA_START= /DNA_END= /DNA_ORIENTATION=
MQLCRAPSQIAAWPMQGWDSADLLAGAHCQLAHGSSASQTERASHSR